MFWKLNPKSLQPFFEAYKENYQDDLERRNFQAWLNGLYVQHAIGSSFSKKHKYLSKPIELFAKEKQKELTDKEKMELIQARFMLHIKEINKQFRKKGG